ncbi:MAG: YDG domain-containing protein [Oscillospiraceae bacterium]
MKKKVIAIALYIALLMTSLVPVTALAVGDTEGSTEPDAPLCTCTTKCAEGAVNSACPVCGAEGAEFAQVCKGQVPQPDGDQGGSTPDGENEPGDDEGKPGPVVRSNSLSITGATLAPKTYDGTTDGTVQSVSFADGQSLVLGTDYTATVVYNDPNAGTDKNATVTVTLINGNYSLASGGKTATIQATGNIDPRPVELKWSEPTVFTYDGTEKSVSAEITNLVGNDEVTLTYSGNSATDASANNYTASVISLGGAAAHNYTLVGGTGTSLNWSIGSMDIAGAVVTIAGDSFTYDGNAIMPGVTVSLEDTGLTGGVDYSVAYSDNTDAGEATVTVTGMGNYSGEAGKSFTINPAPLTIADATVSPKTYDGKTDGTAESVIFDGVPGGQALALKTDYTATVVYDSADAGTDKTATVTVTMKNSNYSLEKNTIELDNQTITKATYADEKTASGYIVADSSLYSVRLPVIPAGASYGEPTYDGSDGAVTGLSIKDGVLHYTGSSGIVAASEYTVTVPVNGGSNYKDYNITVTLTGSDNVVLSGEPTLSSDTITYGQKLSDITLSGSMYAGATQVSGVFTWNAPNTMPGAGTYPAQWTFTSNEGTATDSTQITVKQRPVELDWGTTVFTYDGTEKSVSATITNVVENDDVVPVYGGTISGTEIKTYAATVIDLDGTDAANYTIVGVANASQEWSIKSPVTMVSSVTMSRSSLRIYEGKSYSLSAAVSPADATNKSLYWSSSNPDIASVDQNGKVTGHKPGVCTVFAQAQDGSKVFAACTVRVLHWYPGATPITGDSSHLGLWIGVLAVSACAIAAGAFILVKKRKSK